MSGEDYKATAAGEIVEHSEDNSMFDIPERLEESFKVVTAKRLNRVIE